MVGVTLSVLLSADIKSKGAFRKRAYRLIECDGTRGACLARVVSVLGLSPDTGKPLAFACRVSPRIWRCLHNRQGMPRFREDYGDKQDSHIAAI